MDDAYIEIRDGGYYVRESRVSLDSIVYNWREGLSAEEIRDNFPSLKLVEVYGAITYYLGHQAEIDQHLREWEAKYEAQYTASKATHPEWYADLHQRIAEARKRLEASPVSCPPDCPVDP